MLGVFGRKYSPEQAQASRLEGRAIEQTCLAPDTVYSGAPLERNTRCDS